MLTHRRDGQASVTLLEAKCATLDQELVDVKKET